MKFLGLCMLLAAGLVTGGAKAQEAAVKELIPTGKLRFGVAFRSENVRPFRRQGCGREPAWRHG
jgi:hypothetical protein